MSVVYNITAQLSIHPLFSSSFKHFKNTNFHEFWSKYQDFSIVYKCKYIKIYLNICLHVTKGCKILLSNILQMDCIRKQERYKTLAPCLFTEIKQTLGDRLRNKCVAADKWASAQSLQYCKNQDKTLTWWCMTGGSYLTNSLNVDLSQRHHIKSQSTHDLAACLHIIHLIIITIF